MHYKSATMMNLKLIKATPPAHKPAFNGSSWQLCTLPLLYISCHNDPYFYAPLRR